MLKQLLIMLPAVFLMAACEDFNVEKKSKKLKSDPKPEKVVTDNDVKALREKNASSPEMKDMCALSKKLSVDFWKKATPVNIMRAVECGRNFDSKDLKNLARYSTNPTVAYLVVREMDRLSHADVDYLVKYTINADVMKILIPFFNEYNFTEHCNYYIEDAKLYNFNPSVAKILEKSCTQKVDTTPLIQSLRQGNLKKSMALIIAGADVNQGDVFGETPLSYAVMRNDFEMAYFLVCAGADVNQGDVLQKAVAVSSDAMVKMLLKSGANPN